MSEFIEETTETVNSDPGLDPRGQSEAVEAGGDAPDGEVDEMQALRNEVAEARNQAAASHDKYLRALADMENYKKRIERTYTDLAKSSKKDLLKKLLAVKDNLERALQYAGASQNGEGVLEGVRLTQYQLAQLLESEGVREIEAVGKPFDPRLEEAVHSVNNPDLPDHQVVEVARKGYTYSYTNQDENEVLRPAQVVVNVHQEADA